MLRLIILTSILGLAISSDEQVIDSRIQQEIESLRLSKVDTFLVYSLPCPGSVTNFRIDTCAYEETQYLFWKQNANCYIKKFDFCNIYTPILLDSINPLSFYLMKRNQIDKEKIKPPTYFQSKDIAISSTVDHTCFYEMIFLLNDKIIFKRVSFYDLTFEKFDNGKRNIYYTHNQRTKLKKLVDLLDKIDL
jgi:hypothetical protein